MADIENTKNSWVIDLIEHPSTNLVDVIARTCGWNPLVVYEEMTVHYDDKKYKIKRTK